MKNCAEIREMISAYIDEELKLNEMRKLTKHFEICPACREEYEELRKISELCNEMEEEELPVNFKAELYDKLNIKISEKNSNIVSCFIKSTGGPGRYVKLISTAAACILIVFIAKGFLENPFRYDNYSSGKKAAAEQYTAGNTSSTYGGISNQAQKDTAEAEAGSVPKVKSGPADGNRQNTAAMQMFDMAAADTAGQSGGTRANTASPSNLKTDTAAPADPAAPAAQSDIEAATASASATFKAEATPETFAAAATPAVPPASPETADMQKSEPGIQSTNQNADQSVHVQKSAALTEEAVSKAQGFSRSGFTSRSRYMEIRLISNQTIFSEQTAEKIKKLANEYNISSADVNAVKALTAPDIAYAAKDTDTLEIRIEEGKEQEFINRLNTLIDPEEEKITVSELSETDIIKENTEKVIQSQEEEIKPRYTTIVLVFPKR